MKVHDEWLLTAQRAAVHLPSASAVIADLHLGYDEARRRQGEALPHFGLRNLFADLAVLSERHAVRRLVIAGDLVEAGQCASLIVDLLAGLAQLPIELAAVILGNHDRGLARSALPDSIVQRELMLGGWKIVHGDAPPARGKHIHGHWHPCLRWGGEAAPSFLVGRARIILPAFSPDAAGVNVLAKNEWQRFRCCTIAGQEVLDVGPVGRLKKRLAASRGRARRPARLPVDSRLSKRVTELDYQ